MTFLAPTLWLFVTLGPLQLNVNSLLVLSLPVVLISPLALCRSRRFARRLRAVSQFLLLGRLPLPRAVSRYMLYLLALPLYLMILVKYLFVPSAALAPALLRIRASLALASRHLVVAPLWMSPA